jgi:diacylglycerol kinase family enzyme
MYYYLMEPPRGGKILRIQRRISDINTNLGIAGETVVPSPARTAEELTKMGIAKGYSTMVAIGSDHFINKIATSLINEGVHYKTVLGFIPLEENSQLAHYMGTTNDIKTFCQNLKYRKIQAIDLIHLEPNKYSLTSININSLKPQPFFLAFNDCQLEAVATDLKVTPSFRIIIQDKTGGRSSLGKIWGWFSARSSINIFNSIFQSEEVHIHTSIPIPVVSSQEVLAKTPITAKKMAKGLKVIVGRGTIKVE